MNLDQKILDDFLQIMKDFVDSPEKELIRVSALARSKTKGTGFKTKADFIKWWALTLKKQDGRCYYCNSRFADLRQLITHKPSPLLGVRDLKGGAFRGANPEPDRLESRDQRNIYSADNCVLACYYCNNDKSNVYTHEDYKTFIAPAKGRYIEHLMKQLKKARP